MARRRSNLGRRTVAARSSTGVRATQDSVQRSNTNAAQRSRMANLRASRNRRIVLERAAFMYDATLDYASVPVVSIGSMSVVCKY